MKANRHEKMQLKRPPRVSRYRVLVPAVGLGLLAAACHAGAPSNLETANDVPLRGEPAPTPVDSGRAEPSSHPVASAEAPTGREKDGPGLLEGAQAKQPAPSGSAAKPAGPIEPVELPLTPEAKGLESECSKGLARSCDDLGSVLRNLRRYAGMRQAFGAACTANLPAGCGHEAWAIEEGIGGAADTEKGEALHERACKMGHAPSCERLGQLLDRSSEDGHDKKALGYWSRACGLSGGSACRHVGEHYRDGAGTQVDLAAARRAFTRACDTHDGQSCLLLCAVGGTIPFCKNRVPK